MFPYSINYFQKNHLKIRNSFLSGVETIFKKLKDLMKQGKSEEEILNELGKILDGKDGEKAKEDPFIMQLTQSFKKNVPQDSEDIEIIKIEDETEVKAETKKPKKKREKKKAPKQKIVSDVEFKSIPKYEIKKEKVLDTMQENEEDNEPLIKFEGNASAPLLRYDIPSPSSYEGRTYLQLTDLDDILFNERANYEPNYEDFIRENRMNIYEYLLNAIKEDIERDLYIILDLAGFRSERPEALYRGTFNFAEDKLGDTPTSWAFNATDNNSAKIISGIDGHSKVLELVDNNNKEGARVIHTFADQEKCVIEFWWRSNDVFKGSNVCFYQGNKQLIWLGIENGRFRGYWNEKHHNAQACTSNRWYHHKIKIICNQNRFKWKIDGVKQLIPWGNFRNGGSRVNAMSMNTYSSPHGYSAYWDAIGFSFDPKYNVGDNQKKIISEDEDEEELDNVTMAKIEKARDKIQPMLDEIVIKKENGVITDHALPAKYRLFKYFIQVAIDLYEMMPVFYRTLSGRLKLRFIKVPSIPEPRLMFIETNKLTNFPGDYGAGITLKTFSLLPKEETEISIKTWKKSESTEKEASSVLDSFTEEKADEFEKSITAESSQSSRVEETQSYSASVSGSAGWGCCSVSASASASGSTSSTREQSSKNVMNATAKHAQTSSAKREINIDTSFEKSVSEGVETAIMRKIKNLNASRTLNFTFRQMNQQFHSIYHLTDLRIAFYNGFPGSMIEYSLFELGDLIKDNIIDPNNLDGSIKIRFQKELGLNDLPPEEKLLEMANNYYQFVYKRIEDLILGEYGEGKLIDYLGNPRTFVEKTSINGAPEFLRVIPSSDERGTTDYTIREESESQPAFVKTLDGIIINRKVLTMKTEGVIVESLLGIANALDNFSLKARNEKIRSKSLENDKTQIEIAKMQVGIEIIGKLLEDGDYKQAAEAYRDIFGIQEGLKSFTDIFGNQRLDLSRK